MSTDKRTFLRAFPAQIERSGPRQLTGRLVPYNVVTDVADELADGQLDIYREGFRPGAFEPQAKLRERGSLSRISLVHRHEGGLGYLGPFTALRDEPDGLYGDVAILRSRGDDVEDLLSAGVGELSVEFRVAKANHTQLDEDGTRWRVRAHLDQVALEPRGAYPSAEVLAFRAEVDAALKEQQAAQATQAQVEQERRRVEAEVAAARERQQQWEQMTGRLDTELARQEEYVRQFGVTRPGSRPVR